MILSIGFTFKTTLQPGTIFIVIGGEGGYTTNIKNIKTKKITLEFLV